MPFISDDRNSDWVQATYPFAGASLDKSLPPHQCSGPYRLSGFDGREFGSGIRWPGFARSVIGDVPITGDPAPKYIRRINLNKGSEGHELRGFVILRRHVVFSYYDSELRDWYGKILRYNFGGLQLNSDSFSCSSSNVALYLSWCGQTTGTGFSQKGQRQLHADDPDFFKSGDTIWIERDTTDAEEAVVESVESTYLLLRTNLRYNHGQYGDSYAIEGGSGTVGMTVVTHDGDDFLIEQAGPLHEDGDVTFEVNMIGGTTTPPPTTTTTTEDVTTETPSIEQTYGGDTQLSGTVGANDPTGPTGVEVQTQRNYGDGWSTFSWGLNVAGEGSTIYSIADGTWSRQAYKHRDNTDDPDDYSIKEGRQYRVRTRLADVGDGTPGPWSYSDVVTTLAAPPGPVPDLCTILGDLVAGQTELAVSFPGSVPASGAEAQPVIKNADGDNWTGLTQRQDITPGLNVLSVPALQEGRVYSVRHRHSSTGEWSGESSGDDGRLFTIAKTASKAYSTLASINEPVSVAAGKINGFIIDGGSETVGQITRWNGERWHIVGKTQDTGQYGPATFEFDLPSSISVGDIVSIRTRLVDGGAWSGDLYGEDMDENNRLMDISLVVQA